MAGRIETYVHSDSITMNKGATVVKTTSQTDFAAKTDEFIAFCKKVAKMCYASSETDWEKVVELFPDMETERAILAKTLKEKIVVETIITLML